MLQMGKKSLIVCWGLIGWTKEEELQKNEDSLGGLIYDNQVPYIN
jgi:hypothetical protein